MAHTNQPTKPSTDIGAWLQRLAIATLLVVAVRLAACTPRASFAASAPALNNQQAADQQLIAQVLPAVITIRARVEYRIHTTATNGITTVADQHVNLLGSGFIIDKAGYALTNAHVVSNDPVVLVTLADSRVCDATVVGRDALADIALLKLGCTTGLHTVRLGDSSELRAGAPVMALGNPFGLTGSVSEGIVSARERYIAGHLNDFIQVQADLNPGNSGGPLLDSAGRVVGIATAIYTRNAVNSGIGFAIPINQVRRELPALRTARSIEHGRIGADVHPLAADLAYLMHLTSVAGALVTGVTPGGPAQSAGLMQGDVLISFDGRRIATAQSLALMLDNATRASVASLTINRHGRSLTVQVRIQSSTQGARYLAQTNDFSI